MPILTGYGYTRLAATVDYMVHRFYMRGITWEITEKAGVVASWLLHGNQYVMQHYTIKTSKCITSKIKSQKFSFKEKFANPQNFQPLKYFGYTYFIMQIVCDRELMRLQGLVEICEKNFHRCVVCATPY